MAGTRTCVGVKLGPVMGISVRPEEGSGVVANVEMAVGVKRTVGVEVGEVEIVAVSPVEMGNGLKSTCAVLAIAVLVLLAFCTSTSLAGPREVFQMAKIKAINRPDAPNACK